MTDRSAAFAAANEEQQPSPTTPGKGGLDSPALSDRQQRGAKSIPAFYGPARAGNPPPPFRFSAHRTRIHWHTLHGVDIDKLVREECNL
jgi:hypothetical protein